MKPEEDNCKNQYSEIGLIGTNQRPNTTSYKPMIKAQKTGILYKNASNHLGQNVDIAENILKEQQNEMSGNGASNFSQQFNKARYPINSFSNLRKNDSQYDDQATASGATDIEIMG